MKISVVVQTYNARKHLRKVLESVKDFDEIVLCDMESTDDTLSIARSFGCRIVTFPKGNHTIVEPARDFAIHSASNPWVLVVDADEFVPSALRDYLYSYLDRPDHDDALYVHRRNIFLGKWIKPTYPDSQLRFLDQTKATWPPTIHSVPTIRGKVGQMPRDPRYALVHAGFSISSQIAKMNTYTDNDLQKRSRTKVNLFELMAIPFYRFVHYYIFQGALFAGKRGFIKACFSAITKFYYLAKVYERQLGDKD